MRPKIKLILGLSSIAFVLFVLAVFLFQPSLLYTVAFLICGLLAVLIAWQILLHTMSLHQPSNSNYLFKPIQWPQRSGDPDKLVDRLVSAVEGFIDNIRDSKEYPSNENIRLELQHRLSHVVEETTGLSAGTQTIEVSVLLSDLRGFSIVSDNYSALQVVDMLNRYFDRMCSIIYRHGGTVDKFMGDSIMALFGVPVKRPDYIEQAICCAVEMQIAMDAFNEENENLGLPSLYMGIGINTGEVVAGKIGSDLHSEYTVIGQEVDLASRIESYSLRGQILISQKTYSKIKDLVRTADPIIVSVKGKRDPVPLYELLAIGEPCNIKVPIREARRNLRIDVNIPFTFKVSKQKAFLSQTFEGNILDISTGGMFACTINAVEPYYNVKFRLGFATLGINTDDIFGKILRVKKEMDLYKINIAFTAMNQKDAGALKEFIEQIIKTSAIPCT